MFGKEEILLGSKILFPLRGEIWWVDFNPTVGAEIQKKRPALVVSSDSVGVLPIRLVAPITEWKVKFVNNLWHVKIGPDQNNNLNKDGAVDVLQVRGVDIKRFGGNIGRISAQLMEEVVISLAAVIEYQ